MLAPWKPLFTLLALTVALAGCGKNDRSVEIEDTSLFNEEIVTSPPPLEPNFPPPDAPTPPEEIPPADAPLTIESQLIGVKDRLDHDISTGLAFQTPEGIQVANFKSGKTWEEYIIPLGSSEKIKAHRTRWNRKTYFSVIYLITGNLEEDHGLRASPTAELKPGIQTLRLAWVHSTPEPLSPSQQSRFSVLEEQMAETEVAIAGVDEKLNNLDRNIKERLKIMTEEDHKNMRLKYIREKDLHPVGKADGFNKTADLGYSYMAIVQNRHLLTPEIHHQAADMLRTMREDKETLRKLETEAANMQTMIPSVRETPVQVHVGPQGEISIPDPSVFQQVDCPSAALFNDENHAAGLVRIDSTYVPEDQPYRVYSFQEINEYAVSRLENFRISLVDAPYTPMQERKRQFRIQATFSEGVSWLGANLVMDEEQKVEVETREDGTKILNFGSKPHNTKFHPSDDGIDLDFGRHMPYFPEGRTTFLAQIRASRRHESGYIHFPPFRITIINTPQEIRMVTEPL